MASKTVQLFRLQDKFLTDHMPRAEAAELMEGYPDEYELRDPDAVEDSTPAKKKRAPKKKVTVQPPATQTDTSADANGDISGQTGGTDTTEE
jgi:hypothetical protein